MHQDVPALEAKPLHDTGLCFSWAPAASPACWVGSWWLCPRCSQQRRRARRGFPRRAPRRPERVADTSGRHEVIRTEEFLEAMSAAAPAPVHTVPAAELSAHRGPLVGPRGAEVGGTVREQALTGAVRASVRLPHLAERRLLQVRLDDELVASMCVLALHPSQATLVEVPAHLRLPELRPEALLARGWHRRVAQIYLGAAGTSAASGLGRKDRRALARCGRGRGGRCSIGSGARLSVRVGTGLQMGSLEEGRDFGVENALKRVAQPTRGYVRGHARLAGDSERRLSGASSTPRTGMLQIKSITPGMSFEFLRFHLAATAEHRVLKTKVVVVFATVGEPWMTPLPLLRQLLMLQLLMLLLANIGPHLLQLLMMLAITGHQ